MEALDNLNLFSNMVTCDGMSDSVTKAAADVPEHAGAALGANELYDDGYDGDDVDRMMCGGCRMPQPPLVRRCRRLSSARRAKHCSLVLLEMVRWYWPGRPADGFASGSAAGERETDDLGSVAAEQMRECEQMDVRSAPCGEHNVGCPQTAVEYCVLTTVGVVMAQSAMMAVAVGCAPAAVAAVVGRVVKLPDWMHEAMS